MSVDASSDLLLLLDREEISTRRAAANPSHTRIATTTTRSYGTTTLAQIEERVTKFGKELGVNIVCAQTNYEGEMLELVSSELGLLLA